MVSLLKYDAEDRKIKLLPYYITANFIAGNFIISLYLVDAILCCNEKLVLVSTDWGEVGWGN